jgi:hypothetical protein
MANSPAKLAMLLGKAWHYAARRTRGCTTSVVRVCVVGGRNAIHLGAALANSAHGDPAERICGKSADGRVEVQRRGTVRAPRAETQEAQRKIAVTLRALFFAPLRLCEKRSCTLSYANGTVSRLAREPAGKDASRVGEDSRDRTTAPSSAWDQRFQQ